MYYAGNGSLLVGFEDRKERDDFIKNHVSFGVERSTRSEAMDYPQFGIVKARGEYNVIDPDGYLDTYWSNVVANEHLWHNKAWYDEHWYKH